MQEHTCQKILILVAVIGLFIFLPSCVFAEEQAEEAAPRETEEQGQGQEQAGEQAGQQPRIRRNNFTINPLGLVFGGLNLTYSRAVARYVALDFSILYVVPFLVPYHGFGGEFGVSFWPRRAHSGFFAIISVQAMYNMPAEGGGLLFDDSTGFLSVAGVAPRIKLGWRWLFNNGFNIGLGAGAGWAFAVWQEDCPDCPAGYTCICETVGEGFVGGLIFDLGYAF